MSVHFNFSHLCLLNDARQIRKLAERKKQLDADIKLDIIKSQFTLDEVRSKISEAKQRFIEDEHQRRVKQKEEVASQVAEQISILRKGDEEKKKGISKEVSPLCSMEVLDVLIGVTLRSRIWRIERSEYKTKSSRPNKISKHSTLPCFKSNSISAKMYESSRTIDRNVKSIRRRIYRDE